MPDRIALEPGTSARHVRLATLMGLRWLAIGGQSAAVLVTALGLGFPLPLFWCLVVIGASGAVNIGLRFVFPQAHRLDDDPAAVLLAFDLLQLSVLLYLTGGLSNPFAMLFLAPMMISAASLSPARTLMLGCLTCVASTVLVVYHLPLPWYPGQSLVLPPVFSLGLWTAIVLGAAFTGVYASRVAEEARQLANALAATELVLAREQHLTQLDGLAAAAAHELGTPLATITLVVKEMLAVAAKTTPATDPALMKDDLDLLDQEVSRCRTILRRLASLDNDKAGPMEDMSLSHVVEEVISPHRHFGILVTVTRHGSGDEPVCSRNAGILYGLSNLVENAIDHASRTVHIDSIWTGEVVKVRITDDGPGFSSDVIARFGEPYIRGRQTSRKSKGEEGAGLGLGLFIAKTLLERSGASVETLNATSPATGAIVEVTWPHAAFVRDNTPQKPKPQARRPAFQSIRPI